MTFLEAVTKWLYPFQLRWFRCQSKYASYLKARQLGITTVTALLVLAHCARHSGHKFYIVGTTATLASEILAVIKEFWLPRVLFAEWADKVFPLQKDNEREIVLANGSKIKALASKPKNFRGLVGSFLWDEAAFLRDRDMRLIADVIFPIIDNENNPNCIFRSISTPWWQEGLFWEMHADPFGHYQHVARFETDIHDAIAEGYPFDASKLLTMPATRASREYLCEFWAGASGYFVRELLMDLVTRGEPGRIEQLGVDLGKKHDLTAIVGREGQMVGPTWIVEGESYDVQLGIVKSLIDEHDPQKVVVDATRNETFADLLKAEYGSRIYPRTWTHPWKKAAVESLDQKLTNKELQICPVTYEWQGGPVDNGDWRTTGRLPIVDDVASIEQTKTPSGLVSYDFQRDKARTIGGRKIKGHGDAGAALLMALDKIHTDGAAHAASSPDPISSQF